VRSDIRDDLIGASIAGCAVIVFCLALLWHDPLVFWNDDYELSVLPVFADVARSWGEGHWPILSPYSWVCGNLAGEFQYGVFSVYVNSIIILLWKLPLSFPQQAAAVSIAHLLALAVGAFLLARDRQFSISLSIFVALVASLSGWIICWGATDWFGALGAFTWLPWAWWGAERALDRQRTKWRFLWAALFVYLLVTGGFPYTVLMLLLLITWLSIKSLVKTRNIFSILPMLLGVALGFGLSAPAWLALLDLVQGSARESQPAAAHWQWLVPPAALPGLVLPSWTVNWTEFSSRAVRHTATELACGLVAPAALIAGFVWRGRMLVRRIKWELVLLLIVLLLCMIPTAGLFRWSFRWLPFFHLVLAICAAEVLHVRPSAPTASVAVLLLIAVTVATLMFGAVGNYGGTVMLVYFPLAIFWAVGEWFLRDIKFRGWAPAFVTFGLLLATYLCIPTNCGVPKYNFSQDLLKRLPLDPQRLYLSIYPWMELSYCVANKPQPVGQVLRSGNTAMWAGLHFVNGYSPIRAAGVAREFATTTHGEINPTIGDYLLSYQAGADGELRLLGVDGIVVARELDFSPQPESEWELVVSADEGNVFHRRGAPFARVRSLTSIDSRPNEQFAPATISSINDSRNRVEADIDVPAGDQPALLSFSRPFFRGYQARLGNQTLTVSSYRGLFPLVEVPPESHGSLSLIYRPAWLIWGTSAALACALVVGLGFCAAIYRRRQSIAREKPSCRV
jgi:hypothetical protein